MGWIINKGTEFCINLLIELKKCFAMIGGIIILVQINFQS